MRFGTHFGNAKARLVVERRIYMAQKKLLSQEMAYPTNVLHLATECNNKNHSAAFPSSLPEWFIKLFTQEGDVVLDPFMGSGTTNIVAQRMGRDSI
ncbi:MAG: site-specific DNA-methyltransferase [Lentimicrobiaceae bacterium]|nr:site-specific DNA-methyltransferase [Lentimicrobiaceae bacterium]